MVTFSTSHSKTRLTCSSSFSTTVEHHLQICEQLISLTSFNSQNTTFDINGFFASNEVTHNAETIIKKTCHDSNHNTVPVERTWANVVSNNIGAPTNVRTNEANVKLATTPAAKAKDTAKVLLLNKNRVLSAHVSENYIHFSHIPLFLFLSFLLLSHFVAIERPPTCAIMFRLC